MYNVLYYACRYYHMYGTLNMKVCSILYRTLQFTNMLPVLTLWYLYRHNIHGQNSTSMGCTVHKATPKTRVCREHIRASVIVPVCGVAGMLMLSAPASSLTTTTFSAAHHGTRRYAYTTSVLARTGTCMSLVLAPVWG